MIKDTVKNLRLSATLKINEKSKVIENEGKNIIKFGFGQSPFPVPITIVEELKKNAHQKSYLPIQGLDKLRDSIAKYESKKKNYNFKSDQVIVGPGTKELMFLMHLAFEGEVLLPAPSWVSYKPQSIIANNKYHWIQTSAENNWFPKAQEIEKIILKKPDKKYLLFLNSPNNPSGQVCKNLKEISLITKKYNILVLSDEIYSELTFDENYTSIFEHCPDNVIISNGLSKWCGAGGWRLGYFIIPKKKNELLKSIKVLVSETFSAVSSPIQFAAISAFNGNHEKYILKSKKILKAVGEYVYKNLLSNNIVMNKPMGGFYLLPEFLNKKFDNSSMLCEEILTNLNIALLPGSDFGFDEKRMVVRLSFTDFDGDLFMRNINEKSDINDELIKLYAPKIVEGVNKLKSWVEN